MAIEFLLVTFPEQRAVLADGAGVGFTNHILMLPGDEYEISLEGNTCAPASQVIALAGTSMVKPMVICFDLLAVAMARRAVPAPMESAAVPAKSRAGRRVRASAKSVPTTDKKTSNKTGNTPATHRARPTAGKKTFAKPATAKTAPEVKEDA